MPHSGFKKLLNRQIIIETDCLELAEHGFNFLVSRAIVLAQQFHFSPHEKADMLSRAFVFADDVSERIEIQNRFPQAED